MEKVVKCTNGQCGQHFMHTEKALKCPFCKTEYIEVEEKTASSAGASAAKKEKKGLQKLKRNLLKFGKNN